MTAVATRITPKSIKSALRELEGEIESRSEALPPDDTLLRDWKTQAKQLYRQARQLRNPARRSLMHACRQLGEHLIGLQHARESYRQFGKQTQADIDELLHGSHAHLSALSAAINDALPKREYGFVRPVLAPEVHAAGTSASQPNMQQESPPADAEQSSATLSLTGATQVAAATPATVPAPSSAVDAVTRAANTPSKAHADRWPGDATPLHASLRTDPIIAYIGRLARPDSFEQAREIACKWLKHKRFELPPATNNDFEIKRRNGSKAIAIHESGVWAMQAETLDAQVAGRRWRVELVLIEDPSAAPAISITLSAIGPADRPAPDPTIPGLAGDLIDGIGLIDLRDGSNLSTKSTMVNTPDEVQRLVEQLESPQRQHPIIVLSQYRKDGTTKTMLDADVLAAKLRGLSHVVVLGLEHHASWTLTDLLSKRFSVFGAAVRLFRPKFTTEDAPSDHPYWTPHVLDEQGLLLRHVEAQLLRESASSSLRVLESRETIPAFDDVQRMMLTRRIEHMRNKAAETAATAPVQTRVAELETTLRDANDLADLFAKDKDRLSVRVTQLSGERDNLNSKVIYLQDRVRELEQRLAGALADEQVTIPDTWEDLEEWAKECLGDRVVLTPKAIHAARNSPFEDISFAYKVLLFLANIYVPSKRGELDGGKQLLDSTKAELGVEVGPVGTAVSSQRYKDTYSSTYKGKRARLDMHVQGSSNRDPRHGFRLYFHWDAQDQCVVVGWFPSHLDNTLS